ncbi:MAG: 2OG-Fe(II) oxygenase [Actinomycetota bacterium]|nr:2OG-Fe(II) oxygenase [Actinomycetota bacterium]
MDRTQIAEQIVRRLRAQEAGLRAEFRRPGRVRTFVVDDLLDEEVARRIHGAFPAKESMMRRRSIREDKYVATQMDRYDPLLEEIVFAFQEQPVIDAVADITGIDGLLGDPRLYAGGISAMTRGQFLNPHIDNSHREDRETYRVLNLLYYTTPSWAPGDGGHLQLWDQGMRAENRTLHSLFNRLVVMATSTGSWHAVNEVVADSVRTCVSNYYFSQRPVADDGTVMDNDYFHVTTFRGFPGQGGRNAVLVADGLARSALRRVFRHGVAKTTQIYERDES